MSQQTIRCGYAAIIGKPNAGKSTLLNAILGQKLVITNPKPQTTRKKILGILNEPEYQVIFMDTPGIIEPKYLLQEKMMSHVYLALGDADVFLIIADITELGDGGLKYIEKLLEQFPRISRRPAILLLNKIDKAQPEILEKAIAEAEQTKVFKHIIPISALNGQNVPDVIRFVAECLPIHPKYFPDDIVSDEIERFFVSEIVREKILELYHDEIPYSSEIVIEEFTERENSKHYIAAMIYIERNSQKSILIGKKGEQIKKLGELARAGIEEFLEHPVYLELRVKVRDGWRTDARALRQFGYDIKED